MRNVLSPIGGLFLVAALLASQSGCGGEGDGDGEEPAPAVCPEGDEIRGQCAGVPQAALCDEDACTDGVECAETVTAGDDSALASALTGAAAGTCIALAPGSYGAVTLPAGVRLLGKSADSVSVESITLGPGNGGVVRGVSVGAGGIVVQGKGATIESVRVLGAEMAGIDVANEAAVTVRGSTIEGGSRYGITAADGATVTVENTLVEGNDGPGVWAACSADCDCAAPPDLVMKSSIVRDNHVGGIVLFGSMMLLEAVDVTGTLVGDDFAYGLGGGGVSVAGCSRLTARDLHVFDSQSYGLLIDDSNATVGDPTGATSIEVSGNAIGVWAQHISQSAPQTVTLDGLTVDDNAGVGIGAAGDSVGLIICKTAVTRTKMSDLYVAGGGSQQVGDGLLWLDGSEITIDSLSLGGSARASVVIDGEATGAMSNITLSDGDEAKGIVQQGYSGGAQPTTDEGAPPITTSPDALFAIPEAPVSVPRDL